MTLKKTGRGYKTRDCIHGHYVVAGFIPAFCFLLLLAACGKVGDPLPPLVRIPEPVKDLSVAQSGYSLVLSWTNPAKYIDTSTATDLAKVRIQSGASTIATENVTEAGKPQSYVIPLDRGLGGPQTLNLLIETAKGKLSNVSNTVSITPVEVPGSIRRLRATVDQRKIVVEWDKPQDHPELADAFALTRDGMPPESETVEETRYEDIDYQPMRTFMYRVTALRKTGGSMVAGAGAESITVRVEDKTPPRVPSGLDIVSSDTGAFLTWTANEETDLAGYRVFKSDRPDGDFAPVSDRLIGTNQFYDPSYRKGVYYSVSAVDEFKNESKRSAPFALQ